MKRTDEEEQEWFERRVLWVQVGTSVLWLLAWVGLGIWTILR